MASMSEGDQLQIVAIQPTSGNEMLDLSCWIVNTANIGLQDSVEEVGILATVQNLFVKSAH
jgi:hypothetical protein